MPTFSPLQSGDSSRTDVAREARRDRAIVLAIIVLFLWTGGWLSAGRLTLTRMIDTFEDVNGLHLASGATMPRASA